MYAVERQQQEQPRTRYCEAEEHIRLVNQVLKRVSALSSMQPWQQLTVSQVLAITVRPILLTSSQIPSQQVQPVKGAGSAGTPCLSSAREMPPCA